MSARNPVIDTGSLPSPGVGRSGPAPQAGPGCHAPITGSHSAGGAWNPFPFATCGSLLLDVHSQTYTIVPSLHALQDRNLESPMPILTRPLRLPTPALAQAQTDWLPAVCIGSAVLISLLAGVVLFVALTRRRAGRGRTVLLILALGLELAGLCGLVGTTILLWNGGVPRIPWLSGTSTPRAACTPPACGEGEVYYCPGDCPGGCGTTCATPTPMSTGEHTVPCVPTACKPDEVEYCPDDCLDGCGTACATPTPSGIEEPIIHCTPPACGESEMYYCADDCPGGCGTTCATPTLTGAEANVIQCTPPPCDANEITYCPDECLGGCGTTCATPTPSGGQVACVEAWGWFDGAIKTIPGISQQIGCATAPQRELKVATEDFERGTMIWRQDQKSVLVFLDGGGWVSHFDSWQEGMQELDPAFGPPSAGLIQPQRGFGLVWQQNQSVRESVGWALTEERLCDAAHIQPFEHGLMIECTQNMVPKAKIRVFVVLADGTYQLFSPP